VTAITEALADVVAERGWKPGTHLENRVALLLSRFGHTPAEVEQQRQIGRYRVDFAWPEYKIVLEADGWWHRSPEGAARDAERDSWLRFEGWVVFRVDDRHGEDSLAEQVARAGRIIRSQTPAGRRWSADKKAAPLTAQQRGRIGGLTTAASAPSPRAITQAARDGRLERYRDQVRDAVPDLRDEAEITRRAELLRRADMIRMSAKGVAARRRKAST
jgi:very-short-patch-repair endonuclease